MNKFIKAVKELDIPAVKQLIQMVPKWITWAEDDGKNALHYVAAVPVKDDLQKADMVLQLFRSLLEKGMDKNAIHSIKDGCSIFPATPLWYAYTRGRNKALYTWLLDNGANPDNCMFAIAWYDDAEAASLFKSHSAEIDNGSIGDTPFMGAFNWKRFAVAEWFLQNGADVNFADKKGNTALYYAVKRKLPDDRIKMLLKYGADINKENREGISPKKLAETNHQRKIMKLFEEKKTVN